MELSLEEASLRLLSGNVVAVPTETVYGLAACLEQQAAIQHIFALKKRPLVNPLITHVAQIEEIQRWVRFLPPGFEALAHHFWPGPLTCILSVDPSFPAIVRAHLPTAAFRMPAHPVALELIEKTGPLVMPSANLSGRPSATRSFHVAEDFGPSFPFLEGGACDKGLESTILFYVAEKKEWVVARLGALEAAAFTSILGYEPKVLIKQEAEQPLCPGQLFRHYAPRALLHLSGEASSHPALYLLGFQERAYPSSKEVILLGSLQDPSSVAANLYHVLRSLDERGIQEALVDMDFPREGLWGAIAERLTRAAS